MTRIDRDARRLGQRFDNCKQFVSFRPMQAGLLAVLRIGKPQVDHRPVCHDLSWEQVTTVEFRAVGADGIDLAVLVSRPNIPVARCESAADKSYRYDFTDALSPFALNAKQLFANA
ncbi:MAG: hypothetical protein WD826_05590 [Actinomycetota bacterium]